MVDKPSAGEVQKLKIFPRNSIVWLIGMIARSRKLLLTSSTAVVFAATAIFAILGTR